MFIYIEAIIHNTKYFALGIIVKSASLYAKAAENFSHYEFQDCNPPYLIRILSSATVLDILFCQTILKCILVAYLKF